MELKHFMYILRLQNQPKSRIIHAFKENSINKLYNDKSIIFIKKITENVI